MTEETIGSKLKAFFKGLGSSSKDEWKEKGHGRKLGNAQDPAPAVNRSTAAPPVQPQSNAAPTLTPAAAAAAQRAQQPRGVRPASIPSSRAAATARASAARGSSSGRLNELQGEQQPPNASGEWAGEDGIVISNTPTGKEQHKLHDKLAQLRVNTGNNSTNSPDRPGGAGIINTPTRAEAAMGLSAHLHQDDSLHEDYHLQHCLALVVSNADCAKDTLESLCKIVGNVLAKPTEAKFRQIRLSNPRVQQVLVQVTGAVEFLEGVGFEFRFLPPGQQPLLQQRDASQGQQQDAPPAAFDAPAAAPAADAAADGQELEAWAVLPEEASLNTLQCGWSELTRVMSAQGLQIPSTASAAQVPAAELPAAAPAAAPAPAPASAPTPQAGPVERDTKVVLPVAPDTQVPDWFFARTGAELKAAYMSLVKRREEGEVFMTRAARERQQQQGAPSQQQHQATIRVRFPEGVCLQGQFGAGEPVTAIFEWVTECLRYPEISYELVTPARRPLPASGRVRDAGLIPTTLLNFRTLGGDLQAFGSVPFLSDALLRTAQTEC